MLSLTKPGKLQRMVEDYPPRSRRSGPLKLSTELGQMDQLGVAKCVPGQESESPTGQ